MIRCTIAALMLLPIAAPAAIRISLPEANPTLYLTASLAITFPFNITLGIPIYFAIARALYP